MNLHVAFTGSSGSFRGGGCAFMMLSWNFGGGVCASVGRSYEVEPSCRWFSFHCALWGLYGGVWASVGL